MKEDHSKKEKEQKLPKLLIFALIICLFAQSTYLAFFDFPQLFSSYLKTEFKITTIGISYLYTIMTLPNIITTLLGSFMVQKTGLGLGGLISSQTVYFGVLAAYGGLYYASFTLLAIGRAIYGMALDILIVVKIGVVEKWFTGKYLAILVAVSDSIMNLWIALAAYLGPELYVRSRGIDQPMLMYSLMALFCVFLCFLYWFIDEKYSGLLEVKEEVKEALKVQFRLKHLLKIEAKGLWVLLLYSLYSTAYHQFSFFATSCFTTRFGLTYLEAKNRVSMINITPIFLAPIVSFYISKFGHKSLITIIAFLCLFGQYLYMLSLPTKLTQFQSYAIPILNGLFLSMAATSIVPALVLTIPKNGLPIVLGIGLTGMNILYSIFPFVFGVVNKSETVEAYQNSLKILAVYSGFCLGISVVIFGLDFCGDKVLWLAEKDERVEVLKEELMMRFVDRVKGGRKGTTLAAQNLAVRKEMSEDL